MSLSKPPQKKIRCGYLITPKKHPIPYMHRTTQKCNLCTLCTLNINLHLCHMGYCSNHSLCVIRKPHLVSFLVVSFLITQRHRSTQKLHKIYRWAICPHNLSLLLVSTTFWGATFTVNSCWPATIYKTWCNTQFKTHHWYTPKVKTSSMFTRCLKSSLAFQRHPSKIGYLMI